MTFKQWVKNRLGKKVDYDRNYGVQCVDLVNDFADAVLGVTGCFFGPKYAKEVWINRSELTKIKRNFDFITPTYKNGELQAGDIGIRTSGKYGHIFIVAEPTSNGKIKYYDQNATGKGDSMTLRSKAYTSMVINGVLRPKNQKNLITVNKNKSSDKKKTSYKAGNVYTLQTDVIVRTGPGSSYSQKLRSALTEDGKKHSKVQLKAVLKKGTKITAKTVKTDKKSNIWLEIPSGWVCAVDNGEQLIK